MTLTEAQVKTLLLYLRVDNQDESDLVAALGNSALTFCERYCDGVFVDELGADTDRDDTDSDDTDSDYMDTNLRQVLFTPDIWQAVMLLTAFWYANREANGQATSSVEYILDRHRIWSDS